MCIRDRVGTTGLRVSFSAEDSAGGLWYFDVAGPNSNYRGGLDRGEVVWRTLGRAAVMQKARGAVPLVLLTTQLPPPRSEAAKALEHSIPNVISAVVTLQHDDAVAELAEFFAQGYSAIE